MRRALWIPASIAVAALAAAPVVVRPGPGDERVDVERRLVGSVTNHARDVWRTRLFEDPALAAAAREHSEVLATGVRLDTHEFLRQSLSAHRVLDPFPYVFYGSGPEHALDEIQRRLLTHLGRLPRTERALYTHVGVGVFERVERRLLRSRREAFVTVLLTQRAVTFSPIPSGLRAGERFLFEGEIHSPFREPRVLVTKPDGNTDVLDNYSDDPRRFRTYVRFGEQYGEYQLEVLGRYDMGPRVLALCSLYLLEPGQTLHYERLLLAARAGTLEPSKQHAQIAAAASEDEAEDTLLRLVNRDREEAGLAPFSEDSGLQRMARAHSRDMRDRQFFAHVSPNTGRLADRAQGAGIRYQRIGENIALGYDVYEAQEALMRSPGHRMNLLDPSFTRIGVGVAFAEDEDGRRRVYVTQNFMIPLPY